mgnify:CR=1 FL=1
MDMTRFRTALSGFNRADVANYIERTAREHQEEVRRLKDENTRLQAEKQKALSDVQELNARLEAVSQGKPDPSPAPEDPEAQELAAYRRAEAAERTANQRIRRRMEQLEELLSNTSASHAAGSEEMKALMASVTENMDQLLDLFARLEKASNETQTAMEELKQDIEA